MVYRISPPKSAIQFILPFHDKPQPSPSSETLWDMTDETQVFWSENFIVLKNVFLHDPKKKQILPDPITFI
jgi:hypothetical protein